MTAFALCTLLALTACSGGDSDSKDAKPTEDAKPYASGIDDPFTVKDIDGPTQVVYGHGIVTEIPDGWKPRGKQEEPGFDYGLDDATGLNAVADVKDAETTVDERIQALTDLAGADPSTKIGEKKAVDVPGAVEAGLVEFTQERPQKRDAAALFVQVTKTRTTSFFFIVPSGQRATVVTPVIDKASVQLK